MNKIINKLRRFFGMSHQAELDEKLLRKQWNQESPLQKYLSRKEGGK